jgi:ubiquitin C-terminal hydrolase
MICPIYVAEDEVVQPPSGTRIAVSLADGEDRPGIGLRCAFCDHYFGEFGTHSTMAVEQTQVSDDGEEAKRWGGGQLVWQCKRCKTLGRQVTLEGKKVIVTRTPEVTVEQLKTRIGNTVITAVKSQRW